MAETKLKSQAVAITAQTTGVVATFSTSSTTIVDVTGVTLTATPIVASKIQATISGRVYTATAGDVCRISLWIDGVKVQEYDLSTTQANYGMSFCLAAIASVSAGSRIVKMCVYNATAARSVSVDGNLSLIMFSQ